MNTLKKIPCLLFRGGTSKGAYFLEEDMPKKAEERDALLLKIMGSPDPSQVDGIGGGTFVTSKVAIVNKSKRPGVDVDYKFIQVMVDEPIVDDKPTCGNLLSAVGVFALESGLVGIKNGETKVTVHDINTGAKVIQIIKTPGGKINYRNGDMSVAGVPGLAAPIELYFSNISGGKTGHYLPTGNPIDVFEGVEASCLDISMPTVFIEAGSLGKTGHEKREELDKDDHLLKKLAEIREYASQKMGLGSSKNNVIPKIALISKPKSKGKSEGDINIRYFTPKTCHPAVAVSAGFCLATGCFVKGTIMNKITNKEIEEGDLTINIENPSGVTPISINIPEGDISQVKGKAVRTARVLFSGNVYV